MLSFFTRATVQTRLLIGFGAVIMMMIVITIVGINSVNAIDKSMTVITDINSVKQRYAINFRGSVHDRAIAIRDVVLLQENSELQRTLKDISRLEVFYNESRVPLDQLMVEGSSSSEENILNLIKRIESKTMPLVKQVINKMQQGDKQQAEQLLLNSVRPAFVEWLAAINQFIDYQEVENQQATKMVRETAASFEGVMLVLTGIAFLISGFIVYRIAKGLRISLDGEPSEVASLLSKVAEGDLTQSIEVRYENSVLFSLKKTQNQLSSTVINIADASKEISGQIDIVSTGSADVLALVQQQREYTALATDNLNDMRDKTYTVSELLVQTEENSSQTLSSCTSGSQSVNATAEEIEKVLTTVSSALEKLQKLEQRTKDISGIISVISGISDQTNLLALNAAIEAARAGESGRGFAVVADEVRTLAQSTGSATSEIEAMLTEITKETAGSVVAMESTLPKIEKGLALGVDSAELLKEIENQANNSLLNVRQVVEASKEQIVAIDELYEGMKSVADMADSSTNSLEKNNNVALTLDALANNLKEQIGYFKVSVTS
jgi:methyl-accepting chemotaxis protein